MFRLRECTFIAAAFLAPAEAFTSPEAEGFRRLPAAQITRAFRGKSFSDGVHFTHNYRADGRVDGFNMGKKVGSTWVVKGGRLCVTESLGEICYEVWQKGSGIRLTFGTSDLAIDGFLK